LAQQYAYLRRYTDALQATEQAITLAPSASLYDYRGVLLCLLDNLEEAETSFNQALKLEARSPRTRAEVYFHRGLLYGRQGLFEKALADLAEAQNLLPAETAYRQASAGIERERQRSQSELVLSIAAP
jgi:tetratricopeptide (TPR) repeat protein